MAVGGDIGAGSSNAGSSTGSRDKNVEWSNNKVGLNLHTLLMDSVAVVQDTYAR